MIASSCIGKERYADRLDGLDINWLLSKGCVSWYRGKTETDFPILPSGVTATPSGTWANDTTLNNGRKIKTFDGSTNVISLTDHASYDLISGNLTVCFWTKITSLAQPCGFFRQYESSSHNFGGYWDLGTQLLILYGAGNGACYFKTAFAPTVNQWYFITYEKSGSSCLMFIDAVSKSVTQQVGFSTSGSIGATFDIGRYHAANWMFGNIKDCIICKDVVLSAAELSYIYNTTKKYLRN